VTRGALRLEQDLRSGRFLAGQARGRWKLLELQFPLVFVEVAARDGRRFVLRFDCSGYPDAAPTATLWDRATQAQLPSHKWPRGGRVSQAFNPNWKNGTALYMPCDRESILGHQNWFSEHPWLIWNPSKGLLMYVEAVFEILQSGELVHEAA
jgi:hypothetical protein